MAARDKTVAQRNLWVAAGALVGAASLALVAQHALHWPWTDYRANTRAMLQAAPAAPRIWAHRVNSIGALAEAKDLFAGVEADLVFDSRTRRFSVRHPPKPDTGLTLDAYLARSADCPQLRLWLDWKNPTAENLPDALAELARLDAKYRIRRRALVETPSDATFAELATLSQRGFLHGYYLPTERAHVAMKAGPQAMVRLGSQVRTTVERGHYGAITYDARLQPFVDAELDIFLKQRKLRRFSWDARIDSSDGTTDVVRLSRTIRERDLDALLVSFPSRYRV